MVKIRGKRKIVLRDVWGKSIRDVKRHFGNISRMSAKERYGLHPQIVKIVPIKQKAIHKAIGVKGYNVHYILTSIREKIRHRKKK